MVNKPYKKTEKWWLILTVLFYVLYNFPGIPAYGNAQAALWHGALTLIPLWIIIYVGYFKIMKQRKFRDITTTKASGPVEHKAQKEGM